MTKLKSSKQNQAVRARICQLRRMLDMQDGHFCHERQKQIEEDTRQWRESWILPALKELEEWANGDRKATQLHFI
jgi:hypothetical protein